MYMILTLEYTQVYGFFFGTKPLPFRQKILGDLLTIVYLTAE